MPEVELYGADWCGYCVRAIALLEKKGIRFRNIDVDTTPGARDEMIDRGGGRTIPQIFVDGTPLGGCDDLYALEAQGELDKIIMGGPKTAGDGA